MVPVLVVAVALGSVWWMRGRRGPVVPRRLEPAPGRGAPHPFLTEVTGAVAGLRERFAGHRLARRITLERRRAVPLVAELLRMGVAAGLPPAGALRHAAPWIPGEAGSELRRVVGDLDAGLSLREALDDVRGRVPEFRAIARILQSSAELGTEIGSALGRLARDERETLRRAADTRARTVPVRLLFPLVFLVLPAFVLLGVVPALLAGSPG